MNGTEGYRPSRGSESVGGGWRRVWEVLRELDGAVRLADKSCEVVYAAATDVREGSVRVLEWA